MVYVDDMAANLGRMKMCHMFADSTGELLAMADKIGVQRKWIQCAGTYQEHFDICVAMRARAVRLGAREITLMDSGRLLLARKAKLPPPEFGPAKAAETQGELI